MDRGIRAGITSVDLGVMVVYGRAPDGVPDESVDTYRDGFAAGVAAVMQELYPEVRE